MTDPAEGRTQGDTENEKMTKEEESATNDATTIDLGGDEIDPDDSKAHLINANGGAGGGDTDHLNPDVKIIDGTATSSEAEVSFNGLGKDEVMKYADEPFWKRLRLILFILFWVGWFAMLVTAVIIIVMAPRCPPRPDLKWYQTDTVYQVLPESFKDTDDAKGDGKGDFKGLKEKAGYIFDDLKVKTIWLGAMYKHDEFGRGEGIVDHKETAESFKASADDLKSWMKSLRKEDKRIILDLIPNHTSKKHQWFEKSKKNKDKYKDYYVWAPNDNGQPPNNWESVYGGSAWTLDTDRNEWYLHQFSSEHPDLNLRNPDVVEEIKDIMSFWLEAGVSGFHVRDVEYLVENPDLADDDTDKSQTRNYNGTLTFLEELRKVVNSFSDKPGRERLLFATMNHISGDDALDYWGPKDRKRLHIVAPVMSEINQNSDAMEIKTWMEAHLTDDRHQWMGYALGSDSVSRIATRMGTPEKLTIAHAIQLLMPGTPFNYYGDEFGQKDVNVPVNKQLDPMGHDAYRTPMQWDSSTNAGFTKGNPYLPIGTDYKKNHVDYGTALFTSESPLQAFSKMVELRGEKESLQFGKTKVCAPDNDLLLINRKAERFPFHLALLNMGDSQKTINLGSLDCVDTKAKGKVLFHSRNELVDEELDFHDNSVALLAGDVVLVEFAADEE